MVLVAVAGGTSPSLGRALVQAILATGKHKVIILSRAQANTDADADSNPNPNTTKSKHGAPIHYVDYNSTSSLTSALKDIDVVISVLKIADPGAMLKYHQNILTACQANNTSRFIMSDWSLATVAHSKVDVLEHKAQMLQLCKQENARPGSRTACSTIQTGMFMNYFAQGSPNHPTANDADDNVNAKGNEITAGLTDDLMLADIDIRQGRLIIPVSASGSPVPISMTHIQDIGDLVALSLDLPSSVMKNDLGLVSQSVTFAHVRDILTTKCGMDIPYHAVSRETCNAQIAQYDRALAQAGEKGEFDLASFMKRMVAQMVGVQCDGENEGAVIEPTLNRLLDQHGIGVPTRKVEDLLVQAWGKSSI